MKKKPSHSAPLEPARLDALRKLARTGKIEEALARLDKLIEQHPTYKPLYGLGWEIANYSDDASLVLERALAWTEVSPNSAQAWQALADVALAEGFAALSLAAQGHLAQLKGGTPPPQTDIDTPLGPMSFAAAVANDTARILMRRGRFERALAVLAPFEMVFLRNNLALCHFQLGEIERAQAVIEENWQREPRNLLALERMIRWRLWTHGMASTAGLATPLKATCPLRREDALAKVHALLILGDWAGADAAWREAAEADYWSTSLYGDERAAFDFAGGIAALRLGDFDNMLKRFEMARQADEDLKELVVRIGVSAATPGLGMMPDIPLGPHTDWFPHTGWKRLMSLRDEKATDEAFEEELGRWNAHADYLIAAAQFGGEAVRFLAIANLKRRAKQGDESARQALVRLLTLPCGPDEVRTGLHADLAELGLLPQDSPLPMLVQGKLTEVSPLKIEIHQEATPTPLPPEDQAQFEKSMDLMRKGKFDASQPILERLIARHPQVAMLYHNLAALKEGRGDPDEEIEALERQALELDPDYLFAISALARIEARRGNFEEAKNLLARIMGRQRYHYSEWQSILQTQLHMAKAQGDFGAFLSLARQISKLKERFD